MVISYRPWGPLEWVIAKLPGLRWGLLGSLSTEDRCVAVLAELGVNRVTSPHLLKVLDPDMPVNEPFAARHDEMGQRMIAAGCSAENIVDVPLLATIDEMQAQLDVFLERSGENIILDISSLPKHWFFWLTKMLLRRPKVKNLVVAYSSAEAYAQTLSSNPNPLRALPGFATDDARIEHQTAIVGIGFEPLGLSELYAQHTIERVRYIFPFPPGPPGFHRNWAFVRELERAILNREANRDDRWHIDTYDCSANFDALGRLTNGGKSTTVLAPYGPKTNSLAMCLFAVAVEAAGRPQAPVYYAQPRRYDIGYSTGIKRVGGVPDIKAYCLRLNGTNFYDLG